MAKTVLKRVSWNAAFSNGQIPADALHPTEGLTYYGRPRSFRTWKPFALALSRLAELAVTHHTWCRSGCAGKRFGADVTDVYRDCPTQHRLKASWCARGRCHMAATPCTSNHGDGDAADAAYSIATGLARFWHAHPEIAREHGVTWPDWAHWGRRSEEPWHWEYSLALDRHANQLPAGGAASPPDPPAQEDDEMIRHGQTGLRVRALQQTLDAVLRGTCDAGLYPDASAAAPVRIDGEFGDGTQAAVGEALGRLQQVTGIRTDFDPRNVAAEDVADLREFARLLRGQVHAGPASGLGVRHRDELSAR